MPQTLGQILKAAREKRGLSLREVQGMTDIHNAHLSQIENDTIAKPDMAMLWELSALYDLAYRRLLRLAGYSESDESSGRSRQRMTAAFRAMDELSPKEQNEALQFMAELRGRQLK